MSFLLGFALGSLATFLVMRKQIVRLKEHKVGLYNQLLQLQNGFSVFQDTVASQELKDSLPPTRVQ